MSDVSVTNAPPPANAPAPTIQGGEAVVNQNPVNTPQPLGNQAPPKPEGQEDNKSSQVSRREAIAKAFERAKQNEVTADARQQKTRTAPKSAPAADPNEGNQEPGQEAKGQRYREGGRFARDPSKSENQQDHGEAGQQQTPKYQPLHEQAPFREPPQRFSEQAKSEWAGAPESVRGAVHQMQREFSGAYQKYREAAEVIEPIRPFYEMARQHGTTLEKALTNYVGMEQKLRTDLVGGLDVIVRNLGLKAQDGTPITLQDVAHHVLTMTPEQHRMTVQGNQTQAIDMRMGQLHQTVESLAQTVGKMQYQQQFTHTRSAVDVFADNHPRFDELSDLIKMELDHGYSLEDAYRRAELLRPATHAAQTRNTPAQTRPSKSISGAPDTGLSDRRASKGDKHPSRREAIAKAMRRVNGAA